MYEPERGLSSTSTRSPQTSDRDLKNPQESDHNHDNSTISPILLVTSGPRTFQSGSICCMVLVLLMLRTYKRLELQSRLIFLCTDCFINFKCAEMFKILRHTIKKHLLHGASFHDAVNIKQIVS